MLAKIVVGVYSKPKVGEEISGDAYFAYEHEGIFLGAVIDGLGHGKHAHTASSLALEYIKNDPFAPLYDLIWGCHSKLTCTRGAALSLVRIVHKENRVEFAGVGNVSFKIYSKEKYHPITVPGIVGKNIRKVQTFSHQAWDGDVICIYSDGISSRFDLMEFQSMELNHMVESVGNIYRKKNDDSTIMIIKCLENN